MNPSAAVDRDRVGPYVLVKAIGAGGSARVDLARIERAYGFQRHVVIKRPLEHLRDDARAAESLRREARLGARLRHPNLVAILDAGVHDGYDYLVLEYVHGASLRELMQTEEGARVRDVPLEVALAIVRDVARGLHEAHELHDESGAPLGLVHRDVSPGNVLIGADGAVKLADFGIAKETRVATLSGSMHGTVTYMAPEQCRGHAFDRRADIFSLGVILYELVTGTRLFWADNDVASLHRVLAGTVPRPRRIKPSIAPALEDLIMAALAHDPERRIGSARELADSLERWGAELGQIVAARSTARWVQGTLGPHEAPWIGVTTAVDTPALDDSELADDTSLVALIEATPPPAEPPSARFGPSDDTIVEDGAFDTLPAAVPVRPRRALWAAALGGCIAVGIAIGIVATREDRASAPVTAPSQTPASVEGPADPAHGESSAIELPPVTAPALPSKAAEDPTPVAEPPVQTPARTRSRKRTRPAAVAKPATPVAKPSPEPTAVGSGAGSARGTPNVEWDPTMLLPSDKKKK